jgi:amino acid permease
MSAKKFIFSAVFACITMFMVFVFWHSVVLTDFQSLKINRSFFISIAIIAYIAISYVLVKIYNIPVLKKEIHNKFLRGVICGSSLGLVLIITVTVLGLSFTKDLTLANLALDFGWQTFEQMLGGFVVACCDQFIFEPFKAHEEMDDRTFLID